MGAHRQGGRDRQAGEGPVDTKDEPLVAQVIVDLGLWPLDRPLSYVIPEPMADRVAVGSVVRVPLRGRRIRGWVVGVTLGSDRSLKPIAAMSGRGPVFDEALLDCAMALSKMYIQPLSSFLSLFTPDRLGRPVKGVVTRPKNIPPTSVDEDWVSVGQLSVTRAPSQDYAEMIEECLVEGWSSMVVVPEVREGSTVIEDLSEAFKDEVALIHSGSDPAVRSKGLWALAAGEKRVALGGRASVFAPAIGPSLVIVHAEHDQSLKEQRNPYYDARIVAIERVRQTGGRVILASKTPSIWATQIAASRGWRLESPPREQTRSVWPIVEVVEPPRVGLPRRAIAAIIEARRANGRTLVLLPRSHSTRAGPGPEQVLKAISRVVPGATISRGDRPGLGEDPGSLRSVLMADVVVATAAAISDIPRPQFHTCLFLGVDSYLQMPSGRAIEDAFAQIFEAATWVIKPGAKGRLVLETSEPEHRMVQAITRGDPAFFARHESAVRGSIGSPPFSTLVRLTFQELPSDELLDEIRSIPGCGLLGPVQSQRGTEVMLTMQERMTGLEALGTIIRAATQRPLVEVDPRDW